MAYKETWVCPKARCNAKYVSPVKLKYPPLCSHAELKTHLPSTMKLQKKKKKNG